MTHSASLAAIALSVSLTGSLWAQAPARPANAASSRTARETQRPATYDRQSDSSDMRYRSPGMTPRRTAPLPEDSGWGIRNPGGVGVHSEYYPPGNQFQNGGPHPNVPQFDMGPAGTRRDAQATAASIGIQRTRAIQSHIDAYGRPLGWGFGGGYGVGFGGFGLGYPIPY
jgi:hypothetical protein